MLLLRPKMKNLFVKFFAAALCMFCSCAQQTDRQKSSVPERVTERFESAVDSLQKRISVLEQQNANQEEHIKDLESDLENVITFLNNELNY